MNELRAGNKRSAYTDKSLNTQARLDKMIDAILTLRNLGLEPKWFTMDADMLYYFSKFFGTVTDELIEKNTSCGVVNLENLLKQYDFYIMGVPIEPDFHGYGFKADRKYVKRKKIDD